jgi:hypothetical protein
MTQNFYTFMLRDDDTGRLSTIHIPIANVGDKPTEEEIKEAIRKKGKMIVPDSEPIYLSDLRARGVDVVVFAETLEERAERLKRLKKRKLQRELEINMRY